MSFDKPSQEINWQPLLRYVPAALLVLLLVFMLLTSFYTVPLGSEAVVLRFGKIQKTEAPGLHFKLPLGIDTIRIVPVEEIQFVELGFGTASAGVRTVYRPDTASHELESLMLAGDLNIADIEWIVHYRVKDAETFYRNFTAEGLRDTVRDASEAVMRRLVGDRSVDEAITIGREELASQARRELEELLDSYGCGVSIRTLQLQNATPPEPVKDAFDDVNRKRQEKDRLINEARAKFNEMVPAARGQAEREVLEAEGYRDRQVAVATGEASALLSQFEAYTKAPGPTRERLYLETMQKILEAASKKTVIDSRIQSILPMMDLGSKGGGK